jgi:hypothetical protein
MAVGTERDQIFRRVVPESASTSDVMDLEALGTTATLAFPTIPNYNLAVGF